ncbi:hypothetical protein LEN26_007092 [Aphanomyces euteiches]|nr:hypothetical protein AeMF1_019026 [Aphanomyces euteiches]KAH9133460.1 hypothetical protein LEN26_007092 [Aphanomyces euteiches]KAH9192623.1 hypothetical protein AeNC1_005392 [Aphanomyces euteiches]
MLVNLADLEAKIRDARSVDAIAFQGQLIRKRILSKALIFGDVELGDRGTVQIMVRAGHAKWTKESVIQLNWDIHIGDIVAVQGTLVREDDDRLLLHADDCTVVQSWKVQHPGEAFESSEEPKAQATKQTYSNLIQLGDFNACKFHFSNASCTRGDACHFWHGPPESYKILQAEWLQKRAEQKRELALLDEDPHDPHAKGQKSHRARIFSEWLVELFGRDVLAHGSGVVDVAGGKGDIGFELWLLRNIPTTLVDPRVVKTRKTHLKYMKQHDKPKWHHIMAELNSELVAQHEDLFRSSSLIVGMHPDEATEAIVDVALALKKPFAVVPCCVMSRLFPDRECNEGKVATYEMFVKYLKAKHPGIRSVFLPFAGRNQVVFMT